MKSLLKTSMLALAGLMMMLASCTTEESATVEGKALVSFNINADGMLGHRSNGHLNAPSNLGNGSQVNQLVYAVFDSNGDLVGEKKTLADVSFPTSVTMNLAKGQTYDVIFWAQDADCAAYTVSDEMEVTVDYTAALNNDESRDAFFKAEQLTVTGNMQKSVTLKRPFAQVNVGVTAEDWAAAEAAGTIVETSKVNFGLVSSKLNLLDGEVSAPVELEYALDALPQGDLMVDTDGDGTKEAFHYLSMSYVLAPAEKTTLAQAVFTFHPQEGADIELSQGLANLPIQRNYRTNILGTLLSSAVDFTINIDANFEEEDFNLPVLVTDKASFTAALAAGEEYIQLTQDLTLGNVLPQQDVVIDLGGNKLTADVLYVQEENVDVVLKNGEVVVLPHYDPTKYASTFGLKSSNSSLTLENVNADVNRMGLLFSASIQNAKVVIKDSYIKGGYYAFSTNASQPVAGGEMLFENTTFEGSLETGVMLNVPASIKAKNCTFIGTNYQAAFVRSTSVEFEDCTFKLNLDPTYSGGTGRLAGYNGYWGSGNDAAMAPLVVGSQVAAGAAYAFNTTCTLKNCKFVFVGEVAGEQSKAQTPAIYVAKHGTEALTTTLNVDAATKANIDALGCAGIVEWNNPSVIIAE